MINDEASIRLVRQQDDTMVELSAGELTALMEQLDLPLTIEGDERVRIARVPATNEQGASISLNKSRVALRSLSLPPASDVLVESVSAPLGEDDDRQTLREYLDEINALIVLFDDVRLLQSFFSACTEVGASGAVVCQP